MATPAQLTLVSFTSQANNKPQSEPALSNHTGAIKCHKLTKSADKHQCTRDVQPGQVAKGIFRYGQHQKMFLARQVP